MCAALAGFGSHGMANEPQKSRQVSGFAGTTFGYGVLLIGIGTVYLLLAAPAEKLAEEVRAVDRFVNGSAIRAFFRPARRIAECPRLGRPIREWEAAWRLRRNSCLNSFKHLALALQMHRNSKHAMRFHPPVSETTRFDLREAK